MGSFLFLQRGQFRTPLRKLHLRMERKLPLLNRFQLRLTT